MVKLINVVFLMKYTLVFIFTVLGLYFVNSELNPLIDIKPMIDRNIDIFKIIIVLLIIIDLYKVIMYKLKRIIKKCIRLSIMG